MIAVPTVKSPPVILTPVRAVTTPTESTFFTSSYVNVLPIETLPVKVPSTAVIFPVPKLAPLLFIVNLFEPPV